MTKKKDGYRNWRDVRSERFSEEKLAAIDRDVDQELLELDLRELRELFGLTQVQLAELLESSQAEISRLERREDHRFSTLRRIVEQLGGELEIVAHFGDRRIRLRAAG